MQVNALDGFSRIMPDAAHERAFRYYLKVGAWALATRGERGGAAACRAAALPSPALALLGCWRRVSAAPARCLGPPACPCQVVPTDYYTRLGRVVETSQYSVSEVGGCALGSERGGGGAGGGRSAVKGARTAHARVATHACAPPPLACALTCACIPPKPHLRLQPPPLPPLLPCPPAPQYAIRLLDPTASGIREAERLQAGAHDVAARTFTPYIDLVYDLSPILATINQSPAMLLHFLVRLCAVVGGAAAVTSMADKAVHAVMLAAGYQPRRAGASAGGLAGGSQPGGGSGSGSGGGGGGMVHPAFSGGMTSQGAGLRHAASAGGGSGSWGPRDMAGANGAAAATSRLASGSSADVGGAYPAYPAASNGSGSAGHAAPGAQPWGAQPPPPMGS